MRSTIGCATVGWLELLVQSLDDALHRRGATARSHQYRAHHRPHPLRDGGPQAKGVLVGTANPLDQLGDVSRDSRRVADRRELDLPLAQLGLQCLQLALDVAQLLGHERAGRAVRKQLEGALPFIASLREPALQDEHLALQLRAPTGPGLAAHDRPEVYVVHQLQEGELEVLVPPRPGVAEAAPRRVAREVGHAANAPVGAVWAKSHTRVRPRPGVQSPREAVSPLFTMSNSATIRRRITRPR